MRQFIFLLVTFIACSAHAQSDTTGKKIIVGFEADALPFITGGYYGSAWIGSNHMRFRAVIAEVKTPGFYLEDGFSNNTIQAYALIVDYFPKSNFKGFWVGTGLEYWKGQVQTDAEVETADYSNTIFTVGGGYVWKFYKNFYLNPWIAGHLRIAGDTKVAVDDKEFEPSLFTPEFSIKIGWHF